MFTKMLFPILIAFTFLRTPSSFANETDLTPHPSTWALDASVSLLIGGSLVRAVEDFGKPISLGLFQKKPHDQWFPFGQSIRFSFFRSEEGSHLADYYFVSWGLTYTRWNLSIYAGYELLLAMFKERIAGKELAITYHDFYLEPYIGVRKNFYEHKNFNAFGFGALHMPSHALKEIFLEIGIGGSLPL